MKGLDTNVLVRYLVADDAEQAERAARFLEKECTAETPGFVNRIVFCELVWVLRSAYGYGRDQIAAPLELLLRTAELRVEDHDAAWSALRLYRAGNCDFPDAFLALTNRESGCETTVTFDQKAGRIEAFSVL